MHKTSRQPELIVSDDPWLTIPEVAAYRRQGVSTVWLYIKKGFLPKPTYLGPKSPRLRKSQVDAAGQAA